MKTIISKYKRKTIFRSWLMSYILILIIALILNIFVYTQSVDMIEKEINKAHVASLRQLRQVLDNRFYDVKRLSLEIAFNTQITSIANYKEKFNPYQRYTMILFKLGCILNYMQFYIFTYISTFIIENTSIAKQVHSINEYATFVPLLLPVLIFEQQEGQSEREPMNIHLAQFGL